jgi:DNA gyrase subunit A
MIPSRPDLSTVSNEVRAYIEALESELQRLLSPAPARRQARFTPAETAERELPPASYEIDEPAEPPTTLNIITITAQGTAKRSPRHLYSRQRRGGMGVFDLDTPQDEPPAALTLADEKQNLLLITNQGRAFRVPVALIPETALHARGASIVTKLNLPSDEYIAVITPEQAQGYLALLSQSGMVRLLRHHFFGEYMKPGAPLYEFRTFGALADACWTPGDGDLLLATRQGRAIRFSEKLVPPQGGPGIRLTSGDQAVAVTPVYPDSGVFLLSSNGKGAIRQMEGFAPNKAPGAQGKIAIDTDRLVAARTIDDIEDIFIISHLSKIIRFRAEEIPPKEGVVQGVICMNLRADEPVAIAINPK